MHQTIFGMHHNQDNSDWSYLGLFYLLFWDYFALFFQHVSVLNIRFSYIYFYCIPLGVNSLFIHSLSLDTSHIITK